MRIQLLGVAVLAAVGLAGCSGDGSAPSTSPSPAALPAESAFLEGTCRVAAPDVLEIARSVQSLGSGGDVDKAVLDRLTAAQDNLDRLAKAAEPSYQKPLRELVVAVGLVRLAAHTGSYRPEQGDRLRAAAAGAIDACT